MLSYINFLPETTSVESRVPIKSLDILPSPSSLANHFPHGK